jgi:hypothetical protein
MTQRRRRTVQGLAAAVGFALAATVLLAIHPAAGATKVAPTITVVVSHPTTPTDGPTGTDGGGNAPPPDPVLVSQCASYKNGLYNNGLYYICLSQNDAGCLSAYQEWEAGETIITDLPTLLAAFCPELNLAAAPISPAPTPAQEAQTALAQIVLALPSGHRSPAESSLYNGFAFSYVNLWTYFWTDAATWQPLTATAALAGVSATVTATPQTLTFDPGDGSPSVNCDGPGRPWTAADGFSAPANGACGYQYTKVTGPGTNHPVTSMQTITWLVKWTGTGNSAGTLAAMTTQTTGPLNVLQIQTVTCANSPCR